MTKRNVPALFLLLLIPAATVQQAAQAQTGPGGSDTTVKIDSAAPDRAQGAVPRFIRFSGAMRASNGEPLHGVAGLEFALYKDREGGGPLWMETQNVEMDEQGRYTVLIGSTKNEGISPDLLGSGELRWLGVRVVGEAEPPRMLLVSVPYALRAEDATKLGGSSADEFVRKQDLQQAVHETLHTAASGGGRVTPKSVHLEDAAAVNAATSGPTTFTGSTTTNIVVVQQTGAGAALVASATSGGAIAGVGGGYGIYGKATSSTGSAVVGAATATTGAATGVSGTAASPTGYGVHGAATATTGVATGVYGTVASPIGYGVQGIATATSGAAVGVNGTTTAPLGNAVQGIATSTAGGILGANGVYGLSYSPVGYGVQGFSNTNVGVYGSTGGGASSAGVEGSSTAGTGVLGVGTIGVAGTAVPGGLSGSFTGGPFRVAGNGSNLLAGDPGCGTGFAGVGFLTSGILSGCTNYALLGGAKGDTYINSSGTASIHFRSNNNDLAAIDNSGNVNVIGQNGGGNLTVAGNVTVAGKMSSANVAAAATSSNSAQASTGACGGTLSSPNSACRTPNMTLTLTTSGGPVLIMANIGTVVHFYCTIANFYLVMDSQFIGYAFLNIQPSNGPFGDYSAIPLTMMSLQTPAAGSHTFQVQEADDFGACGGTNINTWVSGPYVGPSVESGATRTLIVREF